MDTEMKYLSRASGKPAHGNILDSRVRGNDYMATSTVCWQRSRVYTTL